MIFTLYDYASEHDIEQYASCRIKPVPHLFHLLPPWRKGEMGYCAFQPASVGVSSSHHWENTRILSSMCPNWPHPFIKSDKSFAFPRLPTSLPTLTLRLLRLNQECKWGWSLTKPGVTYITANDGPQCRKRSRNKREFEWSWPTYKGTTSQKGMFPSH